MKTLNDYFGRAASRPQIRSDYDNALVEHSGLAALERHQRARRMAWLVAVSIAFLAVLLITA